MSCVKKTTLQKSKNLKKMTQVKAFEFSPFSENTYVVFDETGEAVIIDPGCWDRAEEADLAAFIEEKKLRPVRLLNTHCHLDHVFGNRFCAEKWSLGLEIAAGELVILQNFAASCQRFGIPVRTSQPEPSRFLADGEEIRFGSTVLKCISAPGHSPDHLCFWCEKEGFVIGGDVLFLESIGRTDLPGGNHEQLLKSIRERIFTLPPETIVWPGHGPETTVRHEIEYNPFL